MFILPTETSRKCNSGTYGREQKRWLKGSRKGQNSTINQEGRLIIALLRCLIWERETPLGTCTRSARETPPGSRKRETVRVVNTPGIAPGTSTFCTLLHIIDQRCAEFSPHHQQRSDDRKDHHNAQHPGYIGDLAGLYLRLSDRLVLSYGRSGVTLRTISHHPSHLRGKEGSLRTILPNYSRVWAQGSNSPHPASECTQPARSGSAGGGWGVPRGV